MSKKKIVKVNMMDGKKLAITPWGAMLRMPIPVVVQGKSTLPVKMGLSFDRPCLAWPAPALADFGLRLLEGSFTITAPDKEVVVTLVNESDKNVSLDVGQTVLAVYPLDGSDVSFE